MKLIRRKGKKPEKEREGKRESCRKCGLKTKEKFKEIRKLFYGNLNHLRKKYEHNI